MATENIEEGASGGSELTVGLEGITEFQRRFLEHLSSCANSIGSTSYLAARLNTSRVAVVSSGRALERRGLVCSFRSDNSIWASLKWALTCKISNAE